MDEGEVLERITTLCAASSDPVLIEAELALCVDLARRPDPFGNLPTNVASAPVWQAATAYKVGDVVTAAPAAGRWWMCIVPGTSAATQPTWPDLAGVSPHETTVDDGSALVWIDVGSAWQPTWNVNAGVAEGWTIKAAKAAARFDFTTDGQSFRRGQVITACESMAAEFRRRIAVGV